MVRLGEHDLTTTFDGKHDDIRLTRAVPHAQYNAELMLNDIAILYMNRDVNFNGNVNFSHFLEEISLKLARTLF